MTKPIPPGERYYYEHFGQIAPTDFAEPYRALYPDSLKQAIIAAIEDRSCNCGYGDSLADTDDCKTAIFEYLMEVLSC